MGRGRGSAAGARRRVAAARIGTSLPRSRSGGAVADSPFLSPLGRVAGAARRGDGARGCALTQARRLCANAQWSLDSRRTGVLARKVGMMSVWDEFSVLRPITVLRMEDNVVVQVKTAEKDGYDAVQIGAEAAKPRHVTRQMQRHFDRWGAPMRRHVREFRVTPDALLEPGTPISVRHFVPGQMIDVSGITKGKGFQGAMKRWGFAGGRASHGNR